LEAVTNNTKKMRYQAELAWLVQLFIVHLDPTGSWYVNDTWKAHKWLSISWGNSNYTLNFTARQTISGLATNGKWYYS